MTIEDAKKIAGRAAADLIENDMIVGLGTGSTANCFTEALAQRTKNGLVLQAVIPSSQRTYALAKSLHLPVREINDVSHIDITVDGADEIDPKKQMIKGGGGAHVREKILAVNSREMIVVVDETKQVQHLGKGKLPIEILLYGSHATRRRLEKMGYTGKWRLSSDGELFISENGNPIYDVEFNNPPPHPKQDHERILQIPGVVDTGFFFDIAGRVVIGFLDGSVKINS